jgi:hypothetical protein
VIVAVFDCNILVSGIGWGGLPRACLELVFGGQAALCASPVQFVKLVRAPGLL